SLLTEIKKTVRYKVPLSLIMIDIDRFKHVNDKHGHQAGDVVLQELAELITRNVREQDIVTRWGGEEFMILSPFNYVKNAAKLSEKLRVKIEGHRFYGVGTVTCSFGVTQFRDGDTTDSFTSRVDKALYKAKRDGRNRVATE
ncbi:MAG: GGDEF domain-containing protein, partial [Candidatus Brocadiales bacterium]